MVMQAAKIYNLHFGLDCFFFLLATICGELRMLHWLDLQNWANIWLPSIWWLGWVLQFAIVD